MNYALRGPLLNVEQQTLAHRNGTQMESSRKAIEGGEMIKFFIVIGQKAVVAFAVVPAEISPYFIWMHTNGLAPNLFNLNHQLSELLWSKAVRCWG